MKAVVFTSSQNLQAYKNWFSSHWKMCIIASVFPYIITSENLPVFPSNLKPDENGLVALGGELSVDTLVEAYSKGIFPWSGEDPIPWYSPDPRLVLFPDRFHVSESLGKLIKKKRFSWKTDTDFKGIIRGCAGTKRPGQRGTWIDRNIVHAYSKLFELAIAHSVEVYDETGLCGGLYGIALGRCFFGESMFARASNASKVALFHLSRILIEKKFIVIDCQQVTPHMMSLGAVPIRRRAFLELLGKGDVSSGEFDRWTYSG
jgi:leucyl/phenylalanyl-tRNA---protein transferase